MNRHDESWIEAKTPRIDIGFAARCLRLPLLLLVLALPQSSLAALDVYTSPFDDGAGSLTSPNTIVDTELVHVYFDNGSSGTNNFNLFCTASGGDEICQWAVTFETTGDLKIVDIAWNGTAVEDDEPVTPATYRAGTGGDAVVGQRGPNKIATVSVTGTNGTLVLKTPTGMGFVDKDGAVITVDGAGLVMAKTPAIGWKQISVNEDHACGVLLDGTLHCWGSDFTGSPAPPAGGYERVAVTADAACALDLTGVVSCWGDIETPPAGEFLSLAAGQEHICGLAKDLTIACWNPTGDPDPLADPDPDSDPLTDELYSKVSRGFDHACAILVDGAVHCWGNDDFGEASPPSGGFIDIAGGDTHTCGIVFDGSIDCWGSTALETHKPTSGKFVAISASSENTCAIDDQGDTTCWNNVGPEMPAGTWSAMSVAQSFYCAVDESGGSNCWGTGVNGSDEPPEIAQPIIAAGDSHGCLLESNGLLSCWRGDPLVADPSGIDAPPAGTHHDLSSGDMNACAIDATTNLATCWGTNTNGKNSAPGGQTFVQVTTGELHSCGIRPNATLECWGTGAMSGLPGGSFLQIAAAFGTDYACGVGDDAEIYCWGTGAPAGIPSGPFTQVAPGRAHACGLRADGSLDCWGNNTWGQIDYPSGVFTQLAAADDHNCAVSSTGAMECWGDDTYGVVGTSPPETFHNVSAGSVTGTSTQACGVTTTGAIICWGSNGDRQSEPPMDTDFDGREDPVDNCPLTANTFIQGTCTETQIACTSDITCVGGAEDYCSLAQEDTDGDGWGDACDNCATRGLAAADHHISNSDQRDRDADGWGDVCDNCPGAFQINQDDTGGVPGVGDVCEAARLRVVATPDSPDALDGMMSMGSGLVASPQATAADVSYDLFLSCPLVPVKSVELAIVIPAEVEPSSLEADRFGPGCDPEPVPEQMPALTCGDPLPPGQAGCCGAAGSMDENLVDLPRSYAKMGHDILNGGDPMDPAGRIDSIYFRLVGAVGGAPGGNLCEPLTDNLLGNVILPSASDLGTPALTDDQLQEVSLAEPNLFAGTPMVDPSDQPLDFEAYVLIAGPPDATVQLDVSPNLGDSTGLEWLIRLTSPVEIERVTVGFRGPVGAQSLGEMEIVGCTSGGCQTGALGPFVDPASSIAQGPESGIIGAQSDVIYMTLVGNEDSELGGSEKTLNHPDETIPLAVIKVNGTATPFVAPVVTFEGAQAVVDDVFYPSTGELVIATANTGLPVIDPVGEIESSGDGLQGEDIDGDLIPTSDDNCPFIANTYQADNGGFKDTLRNQIGDLCECGEVTGDGQIFGSSGSQDDVLEMQRVLAGTSSVSEADDRCSVSGSAECDLLDLWTLDKAIATDDLSLLRRTCPTASSTEAGTGG